MGNPANWVWGQFVTWLAATKQLLIFRKRATLRPSVQFIFAVSAIAILAPTQTLPAYPAEVSAPGTSSMNSCNDSSADFEVALKRLADTVTERTEIPPDLLQRYLGGCTIETARDFLNRSGFDAGKPAPGLDDGASHKAIPGTIVTEKGMQLFGRLVSLNCRIVLKSDATDRLSFFGFLYFDGP
jgi:hypothetical protein